MTTTSLGSVSNSGSRSFTNAKSTISLINYNRIIGSMSDYKVPGKLLDFNLKSIHTINLPVTNTESVGIYGGSYRKNIIW